jgi:hypothetical protein
MEALRERESALNFVRSGRGTSGSLGYSSTVVRGLVDTLRSAHSFSTFHYCVHEHAVDIPGTPCRPRYVLLQLCVIFFERRF